MVPASRERADGAAGAAEARATAETAVERAVVVNFIGTQEVRYLRSAEAKG
jgi:hypothetical protein